MSLKHRNYLEYARDVGRRLDAHLGSLSDPAFVAVLREGFMLYAFVLEDFVEKSRKQRDLFPKLAMLLFAQHDALRGILLGQLHLSPVTIAALVRIVLETRINFTYIASSRFPSFRADLFARYGELERLAHDEGKPPDQRRFSPAERTRLIQLCPEWIGTRKDGSLKFIWNWWSFDPDLPESASLRSLAKATGLANDYENIYSVTSAFVHGSPLMKYGFEDAGGRISPIGLPLKCKSMSFLGYSYAMACLDLACEFFDVPLDRVALAWWNHQLVESSRDALDPNRNWGDRGGT